MENVNKSTWIWVIYFVGFPVELEGDDPIEPRVGFERIESTEDPEQQGDDAQLAALLRGGQVLAIVEQDDQKLAAGLAAALEKEILRMR
jgi:hypothetical protein